MTTQRKATLLTGRLEDKWFAPYSAEQIQNIAKLGGVWSLNPRLDDIMRAARAYAYGKITAELIGVNARAWALSNAIYTLSPAARRKLERDLNPHGIDLGALGAHVVALMDNTAESPGRGRRSLQDRNLFLDNIRRAYEAMTGKPLTISRRSYEENVPQGGRRHGPGLQFLRVCCEPFPELAELKDGALDGAFRNAKKAFRNPYQE